MNGELNILWMYPDILNLHGDRGNLMAFDKVGKMMGLNVNISKVEHLNDDIDFENSDILFFNVGEIKVMPAIIDALKKHRAALEKFVEADKTIILIGAAGAVMATKTIRNNEEFEGLGFLDMVLTERKKIYGDDIMFKLCENDMEIIGCQIKMLDTHLSSDISLGKLSYGSGNEGYEAGCEGAKYRNVIYTNALGPVFVKNPWYAELIIKNAMALKGVQIKDSLKKSDFEVEINSFKAVKKFIEQKGEKDVSGA